MSTYLQRLATRTSQVGSVLCLGMDPQPDALPAGFPPTLAGMERFCEILLEAALPVAAAVKPNLAFFEAFGSPGIAALERLRARIGSEIPVILDAKRGDIGSTAARQAVALFDLLGADAVTVNPYLGSEAVEPLISRADRFAYVLCRTSNPGAGELQGLSVEADTEIGAPAEPLYARVARRVQSWGPGGTAGLVVGATAPRELEVIRAIAPGLALLVPGVGAQGGEIEPVLRHGPASEAPAGGRPGGGLLVNVSRGIAGAAGGGSSGVPAGSDVAGSIARAAREWASRLAVPGSGASGFSSGSATAARDSRP
jgi:orotidine-5'-phosphate decarboxylase